MTQTRNVALVGLGKMGISHLSIANATPGLKVIAVCDTSSLLGGMVQRFAGIQHVGRYEEVLALPGLDGVIVATPTRFHAAMIGEAIGAGLHVFCEKPLTLDADTSAALAAEAQAAGVVGQVGYHNRFVGTFGEAKRLIEGGSLGRLHHIHAEAYGPVVLKPAARTWRSQAKEGGGCLYDYAAHPINLMNWYAGAATDCAGAQLTRQWSADVEDAVFASLAFAGGVTGQVSVNWSDETARKMTTRLTLWFDHGKIMVDRQEIQVFAGSGATPAPGYRKGWTIRYITELTQHPAFYLRGEEYSAQMEGFARAMADAAAPYVNDFASGAATDATMAMIRARAAEAPAVLRVEPVVAAAAAARPGMRLNLFGRASRHA